MSPGLISAHHVIHTNKPCERHKHHENGVDSYDEKGGRVKKSPAQMTTTTEDAGKPPPHEPIPLHPER